MHGIPNAIRTKNIFVKTMWVICLLISISFCSYFVYDCTFNFLKFERVTTIDVIYEQPTPFPSISICSRDVYSLTYENIIYCQMNYDKECEQRPEKYFAVYKDPLYADCFRFNGENISVGMINSINSTFGGKENGFWLDLVMDNLEDYSSLVVFVHNSTMPPFSLYNKGIEISPGKTHYISIDRIFTEKLSEPFNDCLFDSRDFKLNKTLIKYILDSGRVYSQKECLELCFSLYYAETNPCDCSGYPLENIFHECFSKRQYYSETWNCTLLSKRNFSKTIFNEKCSNYCPLECSTVNYQVLTSTLDFPTSGNISLKDQTGYFDSKFANYEEVKKRFYSLVIFYEDLKYTLITESPNIEFVDLVSNVGGILGVFLGISFLSFIEIVELIIQYIIIRLTQ